MEPHTLPASPARVGARAVQREARWAVKSSVVDEGGALPARFDLRRNEIRRLLGPGVARMGTVELAHGGGRVKAVQAWLLGRADSPGGRLAAQWFRAYFAAS